MKEQYGDEAIAASLNEYKKGVWGDIKTEIFIREDKYRFFKKNIYPNEMWMYIPLRFEKIQGEEMDLYCLCEEVDAIFSNSKRDIQISFRLQEGNMDDIPLIESMEYIRRCLTIINPEIQTMSVEQILSSSDNAMYYFEYKMLVAGLTVHTIYCAVPVNEKITFIKCSCPYHKYVLWKGVFLAMLSTIEITEE